MSHSIHMSSIQIDTWIELIVCHHFNNMKVSFFVCHMIYNLTILGYVEERFRAHFFRSRVYAKKSREFDDAPYLYKVKPNQVKIQPELSPETDAALKKENEEE